MVTNLLVRQAATITACRYVLVPCRKLGKCCAYIPTGGPLQFSACLGTIQLQGLCFMWTSVADDSPRCSIAPFCDQFFYNPPHGFFPFVAGAKILGATELFAALKKFLSQQQIAAERLQYMLPGSD
jgi:hypothetical protein